MRSAIGTRENVRVIDQYQDEQIRIEVLEYDKLMGITDPSLAERMYFMNTQNVKPRQIAIYLNNDKCTVVKGAMSYFRGDISVTSGVNVGNAVGKFIKSKITGEKMVQPEYSGTGLIVLEPSFKHYVILNLDEGESIVVDDNMFYCAQGSVKYSFEIMKSVSSAILGGEGLFHTKLTGPGAVVLELPVPMSEVDVIDLQDDTLKVDGNFSILRSADLGFTVERSAKSLLGSAISGEGLVNVYRGTGTVWVAPTIEVYYTISNMPFGSAVSMPQGTSAPQVNMGNLSNVVSPVSNGINAVQQNVQNMMSNDQQYRQ